MIEATLVACILVAVPCEEVTDAGTVSDLDGFGNAAGGGQSRVFGLSGGSPDGYSPDSQRALPPCRNAMNAH
jgi:hypothetical protein